MYFKASSFNIKNKLEVQLKFISEKRSFKVHATRFRGRLGATKTVRYDIF